MKSGKATVTAPPDRILTVEIDPAKVWRDFPQAIRLAADGIYLGSYDGQVFSGCPATLEQVIPWLEAVDRIAPKAGCNRVALEVLRWVSSRSDVEIDVPVLPELQRIARRAGLPYAEVALAAITTAIVCRSERKAP